MRFLPLFVMVFIISCSSGTKSLFFDIPPPSEEEIRQSQIEAQQAVIAANGLNGQNGSLSEEDSARPAIEAVLDWEMAREQLPEHPLGGVDWPAALDQGLVRPRTGSDPSAKDAAAFKYDFIFEGKKPKFDAIFPHSAHTGWLGCQNCHTALFPYKRNPTKMKEMRQGASCGACHGKVAFNLKQCKRCHINM
jgi:c(7)-type cytochrome triheme protein